jgi:hypothetical protein
MEEKNYFLGIFMDTIEQNINNHGINYEYMWNPNLEP